MIRIIAGNVPTAFDVDWPTRFLQSRLRKEVAGKILAADEEK
jgi:hypothetical protein